MYNPPHFIVTDPHEIAAFIKANPLGIVVSNSENGLFATHLPFYFKDNIFHGHIAKANAHKNLAGEGLLIFTGVQGYISPSHYDTKKETEKVVPTWNYEALHVYGRLEFQEENETKLDVVTNLTNQFEESRNKAWKVTDAPDDFITSQLKGIIALTFTPSKLEFKVKMSQNRPYADKLGVIAGLKDENRRVSEAVKSRLPPS